jgi:LacI family transcriptional regulator
VFLSQSTSPYPSIDFRNRQAAGELARGLVGLGYRRFVVLGGPAELMTSRERLSGLREGAASAGVPIDDARVVECDLSRDGGHAAVAALGDDVLDDADVVVAISDVIAIGAMTALRGRGVRIPEDVGVAGFDDIPAARDTVPPLTTVRLPLVAAGRAAVRVALGHAEPPGSLAGTVVLRDSTPPRR